FAGSAVAVWPGEDGAGVMLSGDSIGPVARDGWVTFMRSFPNYLPLSAAVVRRIAASVDDLEFDRMYGNFGQHIPHGAHRAVQTSAERYAAWVSGEYDHLTCGGDGSHRCRAQRARSCAGIGRSKGSAAPSPTRLR